jgi:hypothetical protein
VVEGDKVCHPDSVKWDPVFVRHNAWKKLAMAAALGADLQVAPTATFDRSASIGRDVGKRAAITTGCSSRYPFAVVSCASTIALFTFKLSGSQGEQAKRTSKLRHTQGAGS